MNFDLFYKVESSAVFENCSDLYIQDLERRLGSAEADLSEECNVELKAKTPIEVKIDKNFHRLIAGNVVSLTVCFNLINGE